MLGPTDPKDAPEGALRGIIAGDWEKLGLKAPCNGGDNAVHASASPNPNPNPNPNPSPSPHQVLGGGRRRGGYGGFGGFGRRPMYY